MTLRIQTRLDESEMIDLLIDLIAIDSRNPPDNEKPCAEFIYDRLTSWGIDTEFVYEPFEDRPQIIARIGDGRPEARTLVLNGHMDVVDPGERDEWSYDPFEGVVEDGRVYGRGQRHEKWVVRSARCRPCSRPQ